MLRRVWRGVTRDSTRSRHRTRGEGQKERRQRYERTEGGMRASEAGGDRRDEYGRRASHISHGGARAGVWAIQRWQQKFRMV
jgi:hypothetical protein